MVLYCTWISQRLWLRADVDGWHGAGGDEGTCSSLLTPLDFYWDIPQYQQLSSISSAETDAGGPTRQRRIYSYSSRICFAAALVHSITLHYFTLHYITFYCFILLRADCHPISLTCSHVRNNTYYLTWLSGWSSLINRSHIITVIKHINIKA